MTIQKQAIPNVYRILDRDGPTGKEAVLQSRIAGKWNSSPVEDIDHGKRIIESRGINADAVPVVRQVWKPKTRRFVNV